MVNIAESVVRVKIESSGHGCGSSADSFKQTVEQAVLEAAPEVVEVIVEGIASSSSSSGFVPLDAIQPAIKEEKTYEESTA